MKRRAVFLDRDGTLNVRPPAHCYVTRAEDFRWLPGAAEAVARLAAAGFVLTVVSNQRGVARGLVTDAVLTDIEARIQSTLRAYGCRIEAFGYCRHELADACGCRKPQPGMLLDLAAALDLDLARSWMIGDAASDVAAGRAAGCHTVLLGSAGAGADADLVTPSLLDAALWIERHPAGVGPATPARAR